MNLLRSAKALLQWVVMMLRRLGIRGTADQSEAKKLRVIVTEPGQHPVRFASVGGAAAAKAALLRLCAPLHNAPAAEARVEDLENKSSGSHRASPGTMRALLYGPQGCGKTLLAHALAGELNLPLFVVSAGDLVDLASRPGNTLPAQLRELVATTTRRAPCVVFVDDLEMLGPMSESAEPSHSDAPTKSSKHLVCEQIVQQLQQSLDGLSVLSSRVVVLGATSQHELLDEAMLRPGRFGRQITLNMPDERERAEIIALLARNHPELGELDALALAARTEGYTGAGLRELLARAAFVVASRLTADPQSNPSVEPADLATAMAECPPSPSRP